MQSEILSGLDQGFADTLIGMGSEMFFEKGTALFRQGDPAQKFYILVKGRVRLSMGDKPSAVYTVNHGGEIFGWSALTSRQNYSASALCVAPSTILSFERDKVERVLSLDTQNAVQFYKNLTQTLGNSLIQARSELADYLYVDDKNEFNIDQIQGMLDFV